MPICRRYRRNAIRGTAKRQRSLYATRYEQKQRTNGLREPDTDVCNAAVQRMVLYSPRHGKQQRCPVGGKKTYATVTVRNECAMPLPATMRRTPTRNDRHVAIPLLCSARRAECYLAPNTARARASGVHGACGTTRQRSAQRAARKPSARSVMPLVTKQQE